MPKGLKGFQKGHKDLVSKTSRIRAGLKMKGRKLSDEWRAKIGAANAIAQKGKKHSKETKKKMSEAHSGKSKLKTSKALRGRFGREANSWKGGRYGKSGEYQSLYVGPGKSKKEHRIVIEQAIGRDLTEKERVHHWDQNKANNNLSNLALLRHESAHQRLHRFAERHGLKVQQLKFEQPWLFQK